MNFLELFNAVAERARPIQTQYTPITDLDAVITESGMDSLDLLMVSVYMCELHGIPEAVGKDMPTISVRDFETFILTHKTTEPESVAAAREYIQ